MEQEVSKEAPAAKPVNATAEKEKKAAIAQAESDITQLKENHQRAQKYEDDLNKAKG